MRRTLEIIGIAALAFMCWVTYGAVYGADRLPDHTPVNAMLRCQPLYRLSGCMSQPDLLE